MPQWVPRVHEPLLHSQAGADVISAAAQEQSINTLSDRTVNEGLAGQGLVKLIFQGVAALDLSTADNAVYQVAFCLDVMHPGDL